MIFENFEVISKCGFSHFSDFRKVLVLCCESNIISTNELSSLCQWNVSSLHVEQQGSDCFIAISYFQALLVSLFLFIALFYYCCQVLVYDLVITMTNPYHLVDVVYA